jgi:Uma2 family endonuclease
MSSIIKVSECHYPESDGKPMGETDEHRDEMVRHIQLLQRFFAGQQVYVSGDLLVYYEQGNPKKFVVPDAFVAKGVVPQKRRVYKLWVEHHVPNVAIETTSRKTRKKDTTDKPKLYAQLGIKEYFIFDPDQEYLDPPLQGYRLSGTDYARIEPDEGHALVSEELGLKLRAEAGQVQFYRRDNGERLLTPEEAQLAAEESQREAEVRAAAAEAEVKRLREELARRK